MCLWRLEEGVESHGTGIIGGCEPPCVCWEPNSGPWKEQQVLFNHWTRISPAPEQIVTRLCTLTVAIQQLLLSKTKSTNQLQNN